MLAIKLNHNKEMIKIGDVTIKFERDTNSIIHLYIDAPVHAKIERLKKADIRKLEIANDDCTHRYAGAAGDDFCKQCGKYI